MWSGGTHIPKKKFEWPHLKKRKDFCFETFRKVVYGLDEVIKSTNSHLSLIPGPHQAFPHSPSELVSNEIIFLGTQGSGSGGSWKLVLLL